MELKSEISIIKKKFKFSLLITTIAIFLIWAYLGITTKLMGCSWQEILFSWIVGFILTLIMQLGSFEIKE